MEDYKYMKAYGFRNVATAIRYCQDGQKAPRIRRISKRVDENSQQHKTPEKILVIEVMACPGACVKGGGQIKDTEGDNAQGHLYTIIKGNYQRVFTQQAF